MIVQPASRLRKLLTLKFEGIGAGAKYVESVSQGTMPNRKAALGMVGRLFVTWLYTLLWLLNVRLGPSKMQDRIKKPPILGNAPFWECTVSALQILWELGPKLPLGLMPLQES
jgi:hypothetical protein